jgi:hypothetical protein
MFYLSERRFGACQKHTSAVKDIREACPRKDGPMLICIPKFGMAQRLKDDFLEEKDPSCVWTAHHMRRNLA